MPKSAALLLALLTAFCWGLAPLLGKAGLQKADPLTGLALRTFTISGILLLILALTGHFQGFRELTPRAAVFLALEGVLASLIGHFAYYYALKYGTASQVVPLVSCFPAVAFIGAVLFLNERITLPKVSGLGLIVLGVLVLVLFKEEKLPATAKQEAVQEDHDGVVE
jgi:transporter family protein